MGDIMRLLIVEDEPELAAVLSKILAHQGHESTICHDGPSALSVAPQVQPDAVLLDIGLPGMNGWDLAPKLRAVLGSEVPLIAITGYQAPKDYLQSAAVGIAHHLPKPNYLPRLVAILQGLAAKQQRGDA
jgi:two-component system CheB/CheR fusion protein